MARAHLSLSRPVPTYQNKKGLQKPMRKIAASPQSRSDRITCELCGRLNFRISSICEEKCHVASKNERLDGPFCPPNISSFALRMAVTKKRERPPQAADLNDINRVKQKDGNPLKSFGFSRATQNNFSKQEITCEIIEILSSDDESTAASTGEILVPDRTSDSVLIHEPVPPIENALDSKETVLAIQNASQDCNSREAIKPVKSRVFESIEQFNSQDFTSAILTYDNPSQNDREGQKKNLRIATKACRKASSVRRNTTIACADADHAWFLSRSFETIVFNAKDFRIRNARMCTTADPRFSAKFIARKPALGYCSSALLALMQQSDPEKCDQIMGIDNQSRSVKNIIDLTTCSDNEGTDPRLHLKERTVPMAYCVLCEQLQAARSMVRCLECGKYYHKVCAKDYGDETVCWNCELNNMIDDSELTEKDSADVLEMLQSLRGNCSPSELNTENYPVVSPKQTYAGHESHSAKRWKTFLEKSTSTLDTRFQTTTCEIVAEMKTDSANSKYTHGFTEPGQLVKSVGQVLDSYAQLQDELDQKIKVRQLERAEVATQSSIDPIFPSFGPHPFFETI